jgi:hypothetical protein
MLDPRKSRNFLRRFIKKNIFNKELKSILVYNFTQNACNEGENEIIVDLLTNND